MIQFAGIAVLVVMLIVGLIITISTMIGYVICYKHAKQKGERIKLWIRIVLRSVFIIGVSIALFPILFFYMLASKNREQDLQAVIRKQQEAEEVTTYDEKINTLEVFLEKDNLTGFRLIVTDSAGGSKYYGLEKTTDGGKNWTLVNADPFDGRLGLAEGIEFFTKDNGYIGITDVAGTYSQIYVTYDGGLTFSKIELQMELVNTLPESAIEKGYTVSDYDYYEMPFMNNGILEINVSIDSSDKNGITFVSDDEGETWKSRINEKF